MVLGRRNKKVAQKKWRPDFREVQTLPDTKVIRTGFLLNFIAVVLALAVISLYVVREYSLQTMKGDIAALESQVAGSTSQNRTYLDANKRFKEKATIVAEAIDFDRQTMDLASFIESLPGIIPEGMILSVMEMRSSDLVLEKGKIPPYMVSFKGRVTGRADASPSQIVTEFQKSILEIPEIASLETSTDLTSFNRNNEFGYFDFTLVVTIAANPDSKS